MAKSQIPGFTPQGKILKLATYGLTAIRYGKIVECRVWVKEGKRRHCLKFSNYEQLRRWNSMPQRGSQIVGALNRGMANPKAAKVPTITLEAWS